ncbi:hypothetical protein ColTof4_00921 [Colletotrichum tofieldiae]|nr:hypothetical protein ColTof3_08142 [Colletotrichum tofieldiae]GKT68498.1 hypothetical protein ColTof4_00921 [Colletotrichum tofieldiae]
MVIGWVRRSDETFPSAPTSLATSRVKEKQIPGTGDWRLPSMLFVMEPARGDKESTVSKVMNVSKPVDDAMTCKIHLALATSCKMV